MSDNVINETLAEYLAGCETDTAANLIAGMNLADPKVIEIQGVPHLITPAGSEVTDLREILDKPKRLKANREFNEPKSFCDYVNQFNEAKKTRIYADISARKFYACLDDHQPGNPSWRDHAADLDLKLSPEWLEWTRIAKESSDHPLDQQELAEFFESHIRQIAEPDAADLLSGIRNVQMSNNWKCTSVHREGGDIAISMQQENNATSTVGNKADAKVPARLTLAILPFLCWNAYPLKVMLTYRLRDAKISFAMKLLEVNELLDQAFLDVRKFVEKETGLTVLL